MSRGALTLRRRTPFAAQIITTESSPEKEGYVAADINQATKVVPPVGIAAAKRIFSDEDLALD
jgi:hypothetical protein